MFNPADSRSYLGALSRYRRLQPDYQLFAGYLAERLRRRAQELGIYSIVLGRAKSIESFAHKIEAGRFASDPVREISDLCGVRIITHTLDEADRVAAAIRAEFDVVPPEVQDEAEREKVSGFGYLSTRLVLKLPGPPEIPKEPQVRLDRLTTLRAEVQIRTIAQHAWASVYHELGYGNEFQLPARWQSEFARLARLLEECDRSFQEIKDAIGNYASGYDAYMTRGQLERLARRLELLLRVDPDSASAAHRLLRAQLALGRRPEIRRMMARHRGLLNRYAPAVRDVGVAYCRAHLVGSEGFREGLDLLRRAVSLNPRDVDALCSLGGALRREGRREEAARCYRDAHVVDPTNPYPLGNVIAEELLAAKDLGILQYYRSLIESAAERCRRQIEARVNLPWAWFDLGIFQLYLGDPPASIGYYAKGIEEAQQTFMIASARSPIRAFAEKAISLHGVPLVDRLLALAWWSRASKRERKEGTWSPSRGPVRLGERVLVLLGGPVSSESSGLLPLTFVDALRKYRGTIVWDGIAPAALSAEQQPKPVPRRVRNVMYVPGSDGPELLNVDRRMSGGTNPSLLESLTFWEDYLAEGRNPATVRVLGFGGGSDAGAALCAARALGARVCLVAGSGGATDQLLADPLWGSGMVRLAEPSAADVRAFLKSA